MWEEFLTKHMEGTLIDPYLLQLYWNEKNFIMKNFELKCEFFKYMGHFTNKDLHEYVLHFLGTTMGHKREYPKVLIGKAKFHCIDNTSHMDWVEHYKHKKIVLEEFMMINPFLEIQGCQRGHRQQSVEGLEVRAPFHIGIVGLPIK